MSAFPTIPDTGSPPGSDGAKSSSITTGGTSLTIALPDNSAAGDIILIALRTAAATSSHTWPSSPAWTSLLAAGSPDGADDITEIQYRKVDGTEGWGDTGNSISVSWTTSAKAVAMAWRVTGAVDPALQPPEIGGSQATGNSLTPTAGTCTPTGGARDYLWLTFCNSEGEAAFSSYPTSHNLGQLAPGTGSASAVTINCRAAGAARQLNQATYAAGQFTFTGTGDDWTAWTVAFHPIISGTAAASVSVTASAAGVHGATGTAGASASVTSTDTGDHGVAATAAATTAATGSAIGSFGEDVTGTGVASCFATGATSGDHGVTATATASSALTGIGIGQYGDGPAEPLSGRGSYGTFDWWLRERRRYVEEQNAKAAQQQPKAERPRARYGSAAATVTILAAGACVSDGRIGTASARLSPIAAASAHRGAGGDSLARLWIGARSLTGAVGVSSYAEATLRIGGVGAGTRGAVSRAAGIVAISSRIACKTGGIGAARAALAPHGSSVGHFDRDHVERRDLAELRLLTGLDIEEDAA